MGAWGTKLYQDDIAVDVRDTFKDLLKRGKTSEEITTQMCEDYEDVIDDPDDGPIFWFALADTQWDLGRLLPEVKKQAIVLLDKGDDLERWKLEDSKLAVAREKVLNELKQKLSYPQPPEKKVSQYRLYKCEWQIGDVFAYQLDSDFAKEEGFYGRHFLMQKIDEYIWHPGHIIPIVYVKITKDEKLPYSAEEYDKLEYVQISATRYEDRFLPIGKNAEEDIAEKSKQKYEVDEYGVLPQYRIKLVSTSRKVIPSKLVHVGSFLSVIPPEKEFIPHSKLSISSTLWKNYEHTIIYRYKGLNLRQAERFRNESRI